MMTEQELAISKLSYVNKDFASIYPDLLDLVKLLTNRWDPSSSNESDPGVVLLKLGAFLADHLNYNIDKNVLENFLTSATQEESVRKIAEFGGYTPRYYRSAVGNVTVTYNPDEFAEGFTIQPFSLVISNDDGTITYTQLETIQIDAKNVPSVPVKFIEGTIERLSIDSDVITLDNIDANRRLYFPNKYIAENGIFIYNVLNGKRSDDIWYKTDYIYTRPIGTKCYKIDYDSTKGLPYIEFPTDIANLIEDGLAIYYIYTSGSYGNVKAGELNTLVSLNPTGIIGTSSDIVSNIVNHTDDIIINNPGSILNGAEPETIDEIKDSYRKVVGTFDTLVSTQDYSNAIRTAENNNGERYISNGLVTDRRNDYNNAINAVSFRSTGTYFKNVAFNRFGNLVFHGTTMPDPKQPGDVYTDSSNITHVVTNEVTSWTSEGLPATYAEEELTTLDAVTLESLLAGMTPYDLIIYALQKYAETDYNSIYYWRALKNSFNQINGSANKADIIVGVEDNLIAALDDYKCINHTFRDLKNGQIYCFKNYTPLNVDIVPYNKVTKYERAEIINNIRKAISDNFNASKLEFGEDLNYDEVKKVIENADDRINYVRLSDFDYQPYVMLKADDPSMAPEYPLNESHYFDDYECTFLVDLAAKNILAGRLCLFDFDENFNYEIGQVDCEVYTDLVGINTKLKLEGIEFTPSDPSSNYKYRYADVTSMEELKHNEYVEIFYPSYYSDKTYGAYVLYNLHLNDPTKTIKAGVEYELDGGDLLTVSFKNDSGSFESVKIDSGIINSSFDLVDFSVDDGKKIYIRNNESYKQIASNESISTRVLSTTIINSNTNVYWMVNNPGNVLFNENEYERILGADEFFIYSDSTKNNLTILGRGTRLVRVDTSGTGSAWPVWAITTGQESRISQQQLAEDGISAKIPFVNSFDFSTYNLEITEMNVITLGEGDEFTLVGTDSELDYNLQSVDEITYKLASTEETTTLPSVQDFYKARTRLDLVAYNSGLENELIDGRQFVTLSDITGATKENLTDCFIQSNIPITLTGSVDDSSVDISMYNDLGLSINWLTYKKKLSQKSEIIQGDETVLERIVSSGTPYTGYAYDLTGKYVYLTNASQGSGYDAYIVCDVETSPIDSFSSGTFNVPGEMYLPFSPVWYNYIVTTSEADILEREYIFSLYLGDAVTTAGDPDSYGKAYVSFSKSASQDPADEIPLGHYGNIGFDSTNNKYYLLNNQSIYVYPVMTEELLSTSEMYLVIDYSNTDASGASTIIGGQYTIMGPEVTWGGNADLNSDKSEVVGRIEHLLTNSSDPKLQFHWLNNPKSDIAMVTTNLADPYSMFDHNNVANIFTIPVIDLESSSIEIVKSMRNY